MSLSDILKLTGRIILLFIVFEHQRALAADTKIQLTKPTKEHINGLYANPFIHNLINNPQYRDRYLEVLFQHFRADFQNWPNSHWPILLQDLQLLPAVYCNPKDARQGHRLMQDLWEQRRDHLQPEPIEDYHDMMVRVPPAMDNVFQQDGENYHRETNSVLYEYLVWEMQLFVDKYKVAVSSGTRENFRGRMVGKVLRFKAFYWLTVLDKFIGTVRLMNAVDGVSPFPRTVLIGPDPDEVAQQAPRVGHVAAPVAGQVHWNGQYASPQQAPGPRAQPPAYAQYSGPRAHAPAYPHQVGRPMAQPMAHLLAQPGPSGIIPGRRAPSPNRGTKRKATHQGGGPFQGAHKRGPGGSMRSMDGALNESQVGLQAQQSNSGCSITALSWISVIMVTIAVSLISFA